MIVYLHFLLRITHNTETVVNAEIVRTVGVFVPVRHGTTLTGVPRTTAYNAAFAGIRASSPGRGRDVSIPVPAPFIKSPSILTP